MRGVLVCWSCSQIFEINNAKTHDAVNVIFDCNAPITYENGTKSRFEAIGYDHVDITCLMEAWSQDQDCVFKIN